MAALLRLHHISLQVSNVEKVAQKLVSRFQFNVFAAKLKDQAKQLALRRGSAVFVVNERPQWLNGHQSGEHQDPRCLYAARAHYPVDTVSNVCFEVEDVQSACAALRDRGSCEFLQSPTEVHDDSGRVTFSIIRSPVGNVSHTLIDRSQYRGLFLPGFHQVGSDFQTAGRSECPITHFDHITFACPRSSSAHISRWYRDNFGFQRFFIDRYRCHYCSSAAALPYLYYYYIWHSWSSKAMVMCSIPRECINLSDACIEYNGMQSFWSKVADA